MTHIAPKRPDCDDTPLPRAPGGQGRGANCGPTAAQRRTLDGPSSRARYAASEQSAQLRALAARVPVSAVLARFGLLAGLRRNGKRLTGCCPIHGGSNRRQFVITDDRLWHCFGDCNRGGSSIALLAALERIDADTAAARLVDWFALSPVPRRHRSSPMSNNRPTHKVLAVSERPDGDNDSKSFFTRIGSAWPIKDGKGLSIVLDALPLNGRLVLLEFDDEDTNTKPAKGKKA